MPDHRGFHKPFVRPAVVDDVVYLSTCLRQADLDEIKANCGLDPKDALMVGFECSSQCYTGVYNNNPFIIFGATPTTEGVGACWALGSDDLLKARREFLRQSEYWIDKLHEEYPLLFNYVDARNTVHIRWLKWLNFKFINLHKEFGEGRLPFYEFVRITNHV